MQDQSEKKPDGRKHAPEHGPVDRAGETRLVAIYRALSPENRRNIMRYAEAVSEIEDIFRTSDRKH